MARSLACAALAAGCSSASHPEASGASSALLAHASPTTPFTFDPAPGTAVAPDSATGDAGAAPAPPAAAARFYDFGGPLIENPKVYVVWWGDESLFPSYLTASSGGLGDFYAGITDSRYLDQLAQYDTTGAVRAGSHIGQAGAGQAIGRGNFGGATALPSAPMGDVTDDQIRQTLIAATTVGALPAPDDDTVYAVYLPPGINVSMGGLTSCGGFEAYHDVTSALPSPDGPNLYYMVFPACSTAFSYYTAVSSHELVESMTDPFPETAPAPDYPQAWNDAKGDELVDVCVSSGGGTFGTGSGSFAVEKVWDNLGGKCAINRWYAQDFGVAFSTPTVTVDAGATLSFDVVTTTTEGAAQDLTLSVQAPDGVPVTLESSTTTSGTNTSLHVGPIPAMPQLQIIVRATGVTGSTPLVHSASLLLHVTG